MHLDRSRLLRSDRANLTELLERLRHVHLQRLIEHRPPRARGLDGQQARPRISSVRVLADTGADAAERQGDIEECWSLLDEMLRELQHDVIAAELNGCTIGDALDVVARGNASGERIESAAVERHERVEAVRLCAEDDAALDERIEQIGRTEARVDRVVIGAGTRAGVGDVQRLRAEGGAEIPRGSDRR